ncbi:MAG: 30S ribosomal protein S4e [Candidatus Aenigmatarchaeota archaeon]
MARLKRLAAPAFWKIPRRGEKKKYAIAPRPGPHPKDRCIPLGIIIRDYLKLAENLKEAKKVVVKVDGKIRRDLKFPVGLMDILEIGDKTYRVVPDPKDYLVLKEVRDGDTKLLQVKGKTYVKGNLVQIHFHDGRNLLVKKDEDNFKTGDVVVWNFKKNKILDVIKLEKGAMVIISHGKNVGKIGTIEKIEIKKSLERNIAIINSEGKNIEVPLDYCFPIGVSKPVIEI